MAGTWVRKAAFGIGGLAVAYFAIEGGEWGTVALLRQRAHSRALTDSVAALARLADSLERYKQRVQTDPATQERIAREQFGYVRKGEVVYKVVDPVARDSTRRLPSPR